MSGSSFDILAKATGRRYHITDSEAGSQMWMDLIAAMLQKQREIASGARAVEGGGSQPGSPKGGDRFNYTDMDERPGSVASSIDIVLTTQLPSSLMGKDDLDSSSWIDNV